jgi:hypothetical protein
MLDGYIETIEEDVDSDPKLKKVVDKLKKIDKKTKWFKKCSMLLFNDKVVHGLEETGCNTGFTNKNFYGEHYVAALNKTGYCEYNGDNEGCGVFIHTDCWKFIKQNYKIELKSSYLPKMQNNNYNKNFNIDYGKIEKYWEQDFDFAALVMDNNDYLCSSPLLNDKNISQIKKNISALKIKNDPKRIGPVVSATFYTNGDIKLGKDNYFWIKKNNKWMKINEKPIKLIITHDYKKLTSKQKNFAYTLPQIGLYNTKPIFKLSLVIKKNLITITFITIESYKETLTKIF